MFQFGPFATWLTPGSRGCPIRKPVDQRLCAAPHGLSQLYASFFASRCLGIRRAPFVTWSSLQPLHRNGARATLEATPYTGYSLTILLVLCLHLLRRPPVLHGAPRPAAAAACLLRSHHVKEPAPETGRLRGATGIRTPDPLLAKQVL